MKYAAGEADRVNRAVPRRVAPDFAWWVLRAHWAAGLLLSLLAGSIPRAAAAVSAAAFLAGGALDRRGAPRVRWGRWLAPLLAAGSAGAILDLLAGSRDPVRSLSFLVLALQAVRFLLPKGTREGWQLCALSYLEFLAAANGISDVRFAGLLFLFLGLSAGAMTALAAGETDRSGEVRVGAARGALAVLVLAAAGSVLTALLFAVTPRLGLHALSAGGARAGKVTGFSGTISLRDVTAVKVDRTVAARVEFPVLPRGAHPEILYLKGAAYSRFDGFRWTRAAQPPAVLPPGRLVHAIAPPARPDLLVADIALEPMETPSIFVYGYPVAIEGSPGDLLVDGRDGLLLPRPARAAIRYRLYAALSPSRAALESPPPGPEYLEIPDGWDDLRDLSATITGMAKTDRERAERLRRHFRTGYRYTLDDPAPTVREFLFGSRAGFCEHYATALALLLRAAGIPSRVSAGYLGGEWNDIGQYLIIRQSDSHAWTEAWIEGRWAVQDATPPAGALFLFATRTGFVGMHLDWAKQRWNKYVVSYSLAMQAEGLSAGWSALRTLPGRTGRGRAARGAAALAAAAMLVLGWRRRRRAGRTEQPGATPGARGADEAALPRPYARLARRLARRGHRPTHGTPMAGMVRSAVAASPGLAAEADRFLDLYQLDRFGARSLSPAESREAARLAARLRRAAPARRAT